MKLKQLNIQNYRGFEQANITFPDNNLAVFIGINGAGKTSILDLLAVFLGDFLLNNFEYHLLTETQAKESNIDLQDAKILNDFLKKYHTGISAKNPFTLSIKDTHIKNNLLNNELFLEINTIFKISQKFSSTFPNLSIHKQLYDIKNQVFFAKKLLENPDYGLPIFVYFQIDSLATGSLLENETKIQQLTVYEQLTANINDFGVFKKWFKQEEDIENQEKVNQEDLTYRNLKLEIIRKALETFFQYIESPVFTKIRIHRQGSKSFDFNKSFSVDSLLIDKAGQPFEIDRLSSGEKSLMLLVADIARRLSIANPALSPAEALQKGEGVVLIDEIEQHLHPRWQRLVLPALQATFPNIQFVVTTHSPQVVSSIARESVFILDNFQILAYKPYTKGRDSNSILRDVFDIEPHSPAYKEKLEHLYRLIDGEKRKEATNLLQELIKDWGEDDREIRRAQLFLDDLA